MGFHPRLNSYTANAVIPCYNNHVAVFDYSHGWQPTATYNVHFQYINGITTGVISARSGFQGDVSLYQVSAPIQPGNSGGPCFDNSGNLIGIVNAKHKGAENVSYAIKSSYLQNLVESSDVSGLLPQSNTISGYSLQNKVKSVKNFVFYIRCK